jgi:hypothetical protein
MEYIHIYELVDESGGVMFTPQKLKHTKAAITKKTNVSYYFKVGDVEMKIARNRVGRVLMPECTQLYLEIPDNELAREIFIENIDELIEHYSDIIKRLRRAKKVVNNFKD